MDFYLRNCFIAECYVSRGTVFLRLLFCDDANLPFIDVLEDFQTVDVVELWMIDDHMLMTDYIHISTIQQRVITCTRSVFTFYHTPLHHKP